MSLFPISSRFLQEWSQMDLYPFFAYRLEQVCRNLLILLLLHSTHPVNCSTKAKPQHAVYGFIYLLPQVRGNVCNQRPLVMKTINDNIWVLSWYAVWTVGHTGVHQSSYV